MKKTQQKSDILDPKHAEQGFMIGKYEDPLCYAAVPIAGSNTKLPIIHQGKILKECRNRQSAMNFIDRHRKGKSVAKLPVN